MYQVKLINTINEYTAIEAGSFSTKIKSNNKDKNNGLFCLIMAIK